MLVGGLFFLWFVGGAAAPVTLGAIGDPLPKVKPEGLLVLDEGPSGWDVLVMHDGAAGGRLREYRVTRP